jgi:hypothetical protein
MERLGLPLLLCTLHFTSPYCHPSGCAIAVYRDLPHSFFIGMMLYCVHMWSFVLDNYTLRRFLDFSVAL